VIVSKMRVLGQKKLLGGVALNAPPPDCLVLKDESFEVFIMILKLTLWTLNFFNQICYNFNSFINK